MASKSKEISRGARTGLATAALAVGITGAVNAVDFHFQSKGVVYESKNEIVIPINSPDYPIYLKNGIAFADVNGDADKQAFDFTLPSGNGSVTDELIKTRNFWLHNEKNGVREIAYFTYFSEYHNQRNLFSVGTNGALSMGPYQFVFNQDGTALVYDTPLPNFPYGNGIADSKDTPMGARFNSSVIPILRNITQLAKRTGDAERRLQEAQRAESLSASEKATLEAEVMSNTRQLSQPNGSGVNPTVNGHAISQAQYDAKVAELARVTGEYNSYRAKTDIEAHNYQNQIGTLRTEVSTLQTSLTASSGRVNELEAIVSTFSSRQASSPTPAEIEASTQAQVQEKTQEQKLQELASREVIPIQRGSGMSAQPEDAYVATPNGVVVRDTPAQTETAGTVQTEKTVKDLYLAGTETLLAPVVVPTREEQITREREHHRTAVANAQSRYAPTQKVQPLSPEGVEMILPEPTFKPTHEEEVPLPQDPQVAFVHEEGRVDEQRVVTSTYTPKPIKKVGLPDESELIFMLGGGVRYHTYPGSLGKQLTYDIEAGIGWAGKFGAVAFAFGGGSRPNVHFEGEEEILPNRTAKWTEDYAGILSGRIALEYHTPHLGPFSLVAGAGLGFDTYTRGKTEALFKYNPDMELVPAGDPVITPAVPSTIPHLSIYGGPKVRITDWLELNANVGYDFDFAKGEDGRTRLAGKGLNGELRVVFSPPSRYNKNR